MKLNEEQLAAVQHPIGEPACLIAGAGSGKTKVLTERVRWLIGQGVKPNRVCVVTFTNKASGELLERLGLAKNGGVEIPSVTTIHSLALAAILRNPAGFGLQPKVTPLPDYQQYQMMIKLIERTFPTPKGMKPMNPSALLKKIQFHRARGLGFRDEYTADIHELALVQHAGLHALDDDELRIWSLYQDEKRKTSVVDFDDMIHLVVRRIRTDKDWREKLERRFDHILMDEAQDTNMGQWEFINGLCGADNHNMYVVGDVSQSIYGFSGAVPQLLIDYSQEWRGLHPNVYKIARNHRSLPKIIDLANAIQSKMTATIPLKMEHFRGGDKEPGVIQMIRPGEDVRDPESYLPIGIAKAMAAEISRDSKSGKIPYRDNCILVRTGIQVRDIEMALVRYRVPYIVRGGTGLMGTEEVRDILSYLLLATNPKDFTAFSRAVSSPKRGMGEVAQEGIRQIADTRYDGDLLQACAQSENLVNFSGLMDDILRCKASPYTAVNRIIKGSNYLAYVEKKYKKEPDKVLAKLDNLQKFSEMVATLVEDNSMTTDDLVFQLTLDKGRENDKDGMVVVSTIHGAKGLEWPRCYINSVVEGQLPHKFSMGDLSEIEEERRIFYVAVTRARDICVIGVPAMEIGFGDNGKLRPLVPSRFLYEINALK